MKLEIFGLGLLLAATASLAAAPRGDTLGTAWQGSPGITETVEQIMAREERLGAGAQGQEATPRQTHNPHNPDASPRHNPRAPRLSQWPPPDASTPAGQPPEAPHLVGTTRRVAQ